MWQGPMDFNTWRSLDGGVSLRQTIPANESDDESLYSSSDSKTGSTVNFIQRCIQRIPSVIASPGKVIHQQTQPMIFHLRCCHPHLPPLALQRIFESVLKRWSRDLMRPPAKILMMNGMKVRKNCHMSHVYCVTHFEGLDSTPAQFASGVTQSGGNIDMILPKCCDLGWPMNI